MKRASEKKKKKLSMPYPLGLSPDLHRPRAIVYHRLPGRRRHVTYAHANILYSTVQTSVCVCVCVCVCFENTLTSRFARFSISPFDFPPSSDCVTLGRRTVVSYYLYIIDNMAPRINIVGTKPCPMIIFYYYHYK